MKTRFIDFIARLAHKVLDVPEALVLMTKWHPEFAPYRAENHSKATAWRGCYAIIGKGNTRCALVVNAPAFPCPEGTPGNSIAYYKRSTAQ